VARAEDLMARAEDLWRALKSMARAEELCLEKVVEVHEELRTSCGHLENQCIQLCYMVLHGVT
jgi:hypothetical protein